MVARKRPNMQGVGGEARRAANQAQENVWIDRITRVGYATRGIIYGLVGYMAARLIFTGKGQITDQNGALAMIAAQPFGKVLLIIIAIGLVGLLIWGFIRAAADPYHKGSDTKGMIARAGYLVSGLSYGALLIPTMNLIRGAGQNASSSQRAQQAAADIMTKSWGPFVIGLIGLVLIGVGIYRIKAGLESKLNERFKQYAMNAEQRRWAIRLGRMGYIAIGIVFGVIGVLALLAATTLDPKKVAGLDGALLFLSRQLYGPWLLAIIAIGLIAFAIYSFMGAMWFRIKEL